ncbi:MAG: phospholipase domain-containing protein [Ginsengibacter sp.]
MTSKDIEHINLVPHTSALLPKQEKGIRDSCPIPYELDVDGKPDTSNKTFDITFAARNEIFGSSSAGSPFIVYAPGKYLHETSREWTYATAPGSSIKDSWPIDQFENNLYRLLVYGPNGFFREFKGNSDDPLINVLFGYEYNSIGSKKLTGNVVVKLTNLSSTNKYNVEIIGNAYKTSAVTTLLDVANLKNADGNITLDLNKSFNWYDITVKIKGNDIFERRYTRHVEAGWDSKSDPAMGMVM